MASVSFDQERVRTEETRRIRTKLEEFLPRPAAAHVTDSIFRLAIDVDREIDRILQDPLVLQLYRYDGQFFTPKDRGGFHRAFDGIHILLSLGNATLDAFFRGRDKNRAVAWLMDHLYTHVWEAKVRRANWEESLSLCCLAPDVIHEVIEYARASRRSVAEEMPTLLSPEEQAFFQPYEEQVKTDYGEPSDCSSIAA